MFLFEFFLCVIELKVNGRNSRYLIPLRIGSPHKMDSACMDLYMQKKLKGKYSMCIDEIARDW